MDTTYDSVMVQTSGEAEPHCQIVRALEIVGEKWSLLIVRDALRGLTRFSEFRDSLGAPSDILTARLAKLVEAGVLEKQPYREPGSRERHSYHLTEAGRGLTMVVAALLEWGDSYRPYSGGQASRIVEAADRGEDVRLAFIDSSGTPVPLADVAIVPGPAAASVW
jgi:DNA-binding HxlR family transcriptional regulator